ncbi:MAG: hypothetical protein RDV48_06880 [Candidatus Eremiobacteraeota bacterium]|nr:hypothetical protein [Candidatus Eremiobacteraeota bacterium]
MDRIVSDRDFDLIRKSYFEAGPDHIPLFQAVLSAAEKKGLDSALMYLEECVTEKRLSWLEKNLPHLERTGDPLGDGFRIFYESYLGASLSEEGEVVEMTAARLCSRWRNRCPTLEACIALGLDTREICRKVYHRPVQAFLSKVDPRLRFDRNYEAIRPYAPYCEESISLQEIG